MSLFSSILEKLGVKRAAASAPSSAPASATGQAPSAQPKAAQSGTPASTASPTPKNAQSAQTVPMPTVDVTGKLESLAASNPQKLNWKTSIVDLLKLLDLDSSLSARRALASELHCPSYKMEDSAEMNVWLHKTVLQKLAQNGGNIPKELLDGK